MSMGHKSDRRSELQVITRLRREWAVYLLFAVVFLISGAVIIFQEWGIARGAAWLSFSSVLTAWLFYYLWTHLGDNRSAEPEAELYASIGAANGLTIIRAVFSAALAGLIVGQRPEGWLAWMPGSLYLAVILIDLVDGIVARVTRRTTLLGEGLDMHWDSIGVFAGSTLVVLYGQAPLPYLLVGLARYLFLSGLMARNRLGLPIYELPPSRYRRALASSQMGFIAVLLLPVFSPPATLLAAVLFMTPFLAGFLRDWFSVAGMTVRDRSLVLGASRISRQYFVALPIVLRFLVSILLISVLFIPPDSSLRFVALVISGAASLALIMGAMGRLTSLVVLLMAGFFVQMSPSDLRYWLLLLLSAILFFTGTGKFSLWKPEEWLIYHRAGEGNR